MKDFDAEQGYIFWMIVIIMVFTMGWLQGGSYRLKTTSADLTEIVQLAEENRIDTIDNMDSSCTTTMRMYEQVCDDRVNRAFTEGMATALEMINPGSVSTEKEK